MKLQALSLLLILFLFSCSDDEAVTPVELTACQKAINELKINQIQLLASHNSYRIRTYEPIFEALLELDSLFPPEYNPNQWDYTHPTLDVQFSEHDIRGIELDIFADPDGRFSNRTGMTMAQEPTESGIPELQEPGFKLIHVADFDFMTNYYSLVSGLTALKNWSDAHPNHIPIFVNIEPKESSVTDILPLLVATPIEQFTAEYMDDLDTEIKSVFGSDLDGVITPDDLRGDYPTLNAAVKDGAWPTLGEARGKVIFILDGQADLYAEGHPSLEGRAAFTYTSTDKDECAFVMRNGPQGNVDDIKSLVSQGYFVRTRSDADTQEARTGDYSRMEAAFESGAQMISTDYYQADPRAATSEEWTDFEVNFPNNELARINAISANPSDFDCEIFE